MQARRVLLLVSLATTLVAACTPQQAFTLRLTSQPVETPTPGPEVALGSSAMSAEQAITVVGQAYALLLGAYAFARSASGRFTQNSPIGIATFFLLRRVSSGISSETPAASE